LASISGDFEVNLRSKIDCQDVVRQEFLVSTVFSKLETDVTALRSHTHDTGNANPQYPADRVRPIQHRRQGSTQSPVCPSSVADPGQSTAGNIVVWIISCPLDDG